MTETTTRSTVTSEPSAHSVWRRALAEPMTAALALDLAQQVCDVLLERDWLLITHEGDLMALDQVIAPAADALLQVRARNALSAVEHGRQPHYPERDRLAFAALCASAAHLAWSTGQVKWARAYARASLMEGPQGSGANLARLVADSIEVGCPWLCGAPGLRTEIARELMEFRRHGE